MPIKTAILGYGRNGSTMHADTVALLPEFVMTAVCDIDPDARRKAADRFGCPVYDDYRRMLEEHALDLVVIVTRSSQHAAMACDCLKRGVNVLVTKPWALHAAQAQTMMDAAAESGALLMPWLPARTAMPFLSSTVEMSWAWAAPCRVKEKIAPFPAEFPCTFNQFNPASRSRA